jgi:hypothetical protein
MSVPVPRSFLLLFPVGAMLAVLGLWRCWGLSERGLLEHDEGHYLLATRTCRNIAVWGLRHRGFPDDPAALQALKDDFHRRGGTLYAAGKHGYIAALALISLPGGVSSSLALGFSWATGMLALLLAFLLFREIGGAGSDMRAGLLVMFGIGLSPLFGSLSREVGPMSLSLAMGLLGWWLLLRSVKKEKSGGWSFAPRAFLAGLALGYGFTCHYNLLPFLAGLLFAETLGAVLRGEGKQWTRRLLWICVGGLVIFALFQSATWLAERRLHAIYPKFRTYGNELFHQFFTYQTPMLGEQGVSEGARGWSTAALGYCVRVLRREGILPLLLLLFVLVGVLRAIRGGNHALLTPLVTFVFMLVFWVLHPWKIERSWGMMVVCGWILGGLYFFQKGTLEFGTSRIFDCLKLPVPFLLGALLFFHGAEMALRPWNTLWTQSCPIPSAARTALSYVKEHGGSITAASAAGSRAPLWKWALIEEGADAETAWALAAVDFSSFAAPDIVFVDPDTWRAAELSFTREAVARGRLVYGVRAENPPALYSVHDLRATSPAAANP